MATALLNGTVQATTRTDCPSGCLGVQGSLVSGDLGLPARDALIEWRNDARLRLEERFQRAVDEGDLQEVADTALRSRPPA
ncbi:hypothetical protein [Pseudonocardia xinjiangensis]|uniref:hypothetical protein n=1 Tax=Pseudonocardia xinjiangensis TaxID=75289 RepID=UPI001B7CE0E6|nr:hypothetical protein [Pseudonocardia xinjiangensis]